MSVKVIASVVIVAAVAAVGGSYVTGSQVEEGFREKLTETFKPASGITVQVVEYDRGIFGATARTQWSLSPAGKSSEVSFTVNHKITHGPLPAVSAFARIRSEPELPNEVASFVKSKFGDTPLLVIDSTLGWSGKVSHHFAVPKYEGDEPGLGKVSWKGVEGDIALSDHGNRIQARIDVPGLSISEKNNNIQIDNIVLEGEQSRTQQYRSIWVGSSAMEINKVAINLNDAPPFGLDTLKVTSNAVLKGEVFDASVGLSAARLQVLGETVEQTGLTYGLENMDAAAFDKLMHAIEELQPNLDEQTVLPLLLEQVPALLERKPAFVLRDIRAKFAEGEAKGDLRIAYVGAGKVDEFNPTTDLVGELHFSLPHALITRLAAEKLQQEVVEEEEDDDGDEVINFEEQIEQQIAVLVDIGLLEKNNGTLSISASFKDGTFGLNGKTLTVEEAMELLQSLD
ncbi:MAG: YdgA family protein [Azoarcus sp.]|nr:YdgA family protein [Azoarcus sp.]